MTVLVTGGSGFIAGHIILQLLDSDPGRTVRATIRSLEKESAARDVLERAGLTAGDRLTFVEADLLSDDGWAAAVDGIDAVLHVASPVMPGHVEDEDAVIVPAREGTLRVLRAANVAGVRRVVLTSAFHAVSWGHPHDEHVFTEADWTNLEGPGVDAYGKAKTLAERVAWDWAESPETATELVTLLPVAVMGPKLGDGVSGANHIIQNLVTGAMPAVPNLYFPIVDVRDVARAHVLAVSAPEAAGKRILLSNGTPLSFPEIASVIRAALGEAAAAVPTAVVPDEVVRAGAATNPQFAAIAPDLGYAKRTSNERARTVLGWEPRPAAEAVAAAARSLV